MYTQRVSVGGGFLTAVIFGCIALLTAPFFAFATVPQWNRTLSFGARGQDVIELQNTLIAQGDLATGNNTGYFGRLTEAAVRKFQCRTNIVCSGSSSTSGYGSVGPRTRAKILEGFSGGNNASASNIQLYSVSPGITEDGTSYLYMGALGMNFSASKNFVTFTPQDPSILPAYNLRSIALPSYAQGTGINLTLNSSQFSYGDCRAAGMCQGSITGFPAGNYYVSVTNGDCTGANCESNKVLVNVRGNTAAQSVDFRLSLLSSSNFAIFSAPLASGDSATNYEIHFGDGEKATMIASGSSCPGSTSINCSPSPITSMYSAHQYVKQGTFIAQLKNLTMSCTSAAACAVGTVTVVVGAPKPPPSSSVY